MRPARVRACVAVLVATVTMAVVWQVGVQQAPARASVAAVPKTSPPQGYTTLDRHGCPIYHPAGGGKIAAFGDGGPTTTLLKRGEHCVTLPATVFFLTKPAGTGRCDGLLLVQAAYPKGIKRIAAVVYSDVGSGTRWWEQPVNGITGTGPGTGPGGTTGFGGLTYKVPKAEYVWQVGAGSGPSPCKAPPLDGWDAWGITAKYAIAGRVTVGCKSSCTADGEAVSDVNVSVDGPTKATATTDDEGHYVVLVSKGSYRVTPDIPGWTFDPGHRSVDVKTSSRYDVDFMACGTGANGGSGAVAGATVPWVFKGNGCLNTVRVTYNSKPGEVGNMTIGWRTNSFLCDTGSGGTTVVPVGAQLISSGTPVPTNLIEISKDSITASFNSVSGVLEMKIVIHANGQGGSATLYGDAFRTMPSDGSHEGQLCYPAGGVLPLDRTNP